MNLETIIVAPLCTLLGWFLKTISDRTAAERILEHRIRVEKEYELYSNLWEKLFELQRAVGQLIELLGSTADVRHDKHVLSFFNDYQSFVHKCEPFMKPSVYEPAQEIAQLARRIIRNVGKQKDIEEQRTRSIDDSMDEKLVNRLMGLGDDSEAALKEIQRLFPQVAQAIRQRVSP